MSVRIRPKFNYSITQPNSINYVQRVTWLDYKRREQFKLLFASEASKDKE